MSSNAERLRAAETTVEQLERDVGRVRVALGTAGDIAEGLEQARDAADEAAGRIRRLLPWVIALGVILVIVAVVKKAASTPAPPSPSPVPEESAENLAAG